MACELLYIPAMPRDKAIVIRVSLDEIARFKTAAKHEGRKMADYIRWLGLTDANRIIKENNLTVSAQDAETGD
jgi:uncharacterized protein (DUF1778 family)